MIKIENISGNIMKVTVPEKLKADDFMQLAPKVNALIKQHGKIRLLVDASKFNGWENMAAFEKHMGFVKSHQKSVERGAIIAGHEWQHWVAGMFKIFVHPEIRVFDKDEAGIALQWISEEKKIIRMTTEILLCSPTRTAIGTFDGSLKTVPAPDLGAAVIKETLKRAKLPADKVESVIMGNVVQAGTGMNPARQAAINGGVPVQVPAFTVNRVCGSGAQSIVSAYLEILSGNIQSAVAGGMENMDQCPYLLESARWGYRMGEGKLPDSLLRDGLNDAFSGKHSGWHTEDLVTKYSVTREQQDAWALRSQQRFSKAQAAGKFDTEITPVEVTSHKGTTSFAKDEGNRPDTTAEKLAKLKPAFRKDGTITAGNAPGLNSAASAMIVASAEFAKANNLTPMARIVAYGIAAVEPGMFGLGPIAATQQALKRANWKLSDVQRVEINEAFAAIAIVATRELGFSEEIVNVEGGAIAHGHPLGATGAILTTRLLYSMQRDKLKRGVVTLCIGGGQGIALALEMM